MIIAYRYLVEQMIEKEVTNKDIAALLDVTEKKVKGMISGRPKFTLDDACNIQEEFFPDKRINLLFENFYEGLGSNPITRFFRYHSIYNGKVNKKEQERTFKLNLIRDMIKNLDDRQLGKVYALVDRLNLE
jgi:hypothetical protein